MPRRHPGPGPMPRSRAPRRRGPRPARRSSGRSVATAACPASIRPRPSAPAMPSRCDMPSEKPPARVRATDVSPTCSSTSCTRRLGMPKTFLSDRASMTAPLWLMSATLRAAGPASLGRREEMARRAGLRLLLEEETGTGLVRGRRLADHARLDEARLDEARLDEAERATDGRGLPEISDLSRLAASSEMIADTYPPKPGG